MKYSVGIIGLGRIGMTYDRDLADKSSFLSHTKSFYAHPAFRLAFLLDPDPGARAEARRRFPGVPVLKTLDEVETFPDVVALAATPAANAEYLEALAPHRAIRLFVAEKPFWSASTPAKWLEKRNSERVYVNYIRKALPSFSSLRRQILSGEFGSAINAGICYSKGLRNNGSHLLDLLFHLFPGHAAKCLGVFRSLSDYDRTDPSLSFVLEMKKGKVAFPAVFNCLDERKYSMIEADLFFEKARVRFYDFGGRIDLYRVRPDPLFPGYLNLLPQRQGVGTELERYGYHVCSQVQKILSGRVENVSSAANDRRIYRTIQQVRAYSSKRAGEETFARCI